MLNANKKDQLFFVLYILYNFLIIVLQIEILESVILTSSNFGSKLHAVNIKLQEKFIHFLFFYPTNMRALIILTLNEHIFDPKQLPTEFHPRQPKL